MAVTDINVAQYSVLSIAWERNVVSVFAGRWPREFADIP